MALDSIYEPETVETIPFIGQQPWTLNGKDSDAGTAIEIKAAPGVGLALYITQVVLGSDDADAHPQIQDEDDNVIFGPLFSTIEGPTMSVTPAKPIKLVSNKALELKAAAAGNVFVFVQGYIAEG